MIVFDQVTFTYPGATRPALCDVCLTLPEGGFTLLVGPSGSGKSTLLRCINGLAPHFSGGDLVGRIRVDGLDPVVATPEVMSRYVGFVFQDPEAQFVLDQVEDEIAFGLENAAILPDEMRVRVEETLDLLDLAPLRNRPLATLSGGERQRVAIAAALALRPKILVLDEPTSQLDPQSAEDVLNALVRLNHDLGLTIVLAEHRLERVLPYADTLLFLPGDGGPVICGDPRSVLAQIELGPPLVVLGKRLGWSPLPLTVKEGRRFSSRLQPAPGHAQVAARPAPAPRTSAPFLQLRRVECGYANLVVNGVDLEVWPGEIVALMGRNGSGKTTLLKSIVGLVRAKSGQIVVNGKDVTRTEVAEICRQVGYLPQDPNLLLFADSVGDELSITLRNHGFDPVRDPRSLPIAPNDLLARLGLIDKIDDYPRDLSVGERQRVALAAIAVTQPRALLLDEPTRGLDYTSKQHLAALLRRWRSEQMAIVVVTHDVELAAALADRVVLLSQGEIIAAGTPAAVLGSSPLFAPQVARLFPGSGWLTTDDVLQDRANWQNGLSAEVGELP